jgi:hypothetical protein
MNYRRLKIGLFILMFLSAMKGLPVWAGNPLYVTGPDATRPGQPHRWSQNPIPYRTDLGGLGNQTNAQANSLVASAFQSWQNVASANIGVQNVGSLNTDVTSSNYLTFQNALGRCSDSSQPVVSIVYDMDGSIIRAMGMDNNSVLGFAGLICSNDTTGVFARSWSVMNGRFIDGSADTPSHQTVSLNVFQQSFVHEFGHLLGLDHSQVNLNCLTNLACSAEDLAGLPVMFPVLLDNATPNLKTDDIATLSMLYPAGNFASSTGRIQGTVFFADGKTPAQGYNVIARKVDDPRRTAVSCVSGFLFTSSAGNALAPPIYDSSSIYGSRDPTLIGYYDIPGLTPGEYKIEVEAINNSGSTPFVGSSGVGAIGTDFDFQFKLPGTCDPQYLNYPSSPGDNCSAFTTVTVGGGSIVNTRTNVIFLGTPPRYDAWEDGP